MNLKTFSINNGKSLAEKDTYLENVLKIANRLNLDDFKGAKRVIRTFFENELTELGWNHRVRIPELRDTPLLSPRTLKNRVGIELLMHHYSSLGTQFLKFEIMSPTHLNYIDYGIMFSFTEYIQRSLDEKYRSSWGGSITYEKIIDHYEALRKIITVPLLVIGIDL